MSDQIKKLGSHIEHLTEVNTKLHDDIRELIKLVIAAEDDLYHICLFNPDIQSKSLASLTNYKAKIGPVGSSFEDFLKDEGLIIYSTNYSSSSSASEGEQ